MNTENLYINQIVKNYPTLCDLLEVKRKKGTNPIKAHLKEIGRFVKLQRIEGSQGFEVENIYDQPKEKIEKRGAGGAPYKDIFKKVILMEGLKRNGKMRISQTRLLELCKMVNSNYQFGSQNIFKSARYLEVDEMNMQEFFERSKDVFNNVITTALNELHKQSLINFKEVMILQKVHVNNFGLTNEQKMDEFGDTSTEVKTNIQHTKYFEEATEEEMDYIMYVERQTMLDMGYRDKQKIIRKNRWSEYEKNVKNKILNERNIVFYYMAYDIRCHPEHVLIELEELENLENELNKAVIDYYKKNTEKRKVKAEKKLEKRKKIGSSSFKDGKSHREFARNQRRTNDQYLAEHAKISKTYYDIENPNITNEVLEFASNYKNKK